MRKRAFTASFAVFCLSMLASLATLAIERMVGIGWDYHPDALTYVFTSDIVVELASGGPIINFFNNGHFFWSSFWNENIGVLIFWNMVFFSITNVILYRYQSQYLSNRKIATNFMIFLTALLIFNPYRLHLSTTVLKDTSIVLMTVLAFVSSWRWLPFFGILLLFLRLPGLLYGLVFLDRRLVYITTALLLVLFVVFFDYISFFLIERNDADMRFREFDQVPTFQEYGVIGSILRGVVWSLLLLTWSTAT
jgi:hypothetical protein